MLLITSFEIPLASSPNYSVTILVTSADPSGIDLEYSKVSNPRAK